jgi:hypothetical protein
VARSFGDSFASLAPSTAAVASISASTFLFVASATSASILSQPINFLIKFLII